MTEPNSRSMQWFVFSKVTNWSKNKCLFQLLDLKYSSFNLSSHLYSTSSASAFPFNFYLLYVDVYYIQYDDIFSTYFDVCFSRKNIFFFLFFLLAIAMLFFLIIKYYFRVKQKEEKNKKQKRISSLHNYVSARKTLSYRI